MFRIKQYLKMLLQNVLLPILYTWYSRKPIRKGSVLLADAHHENLPFAMGKLYETLMTEHGNWQKPELFICDFQKLSFGAMVKFLIRFMKQYATAEYVFICDYFLPASSCRKRRGTKLIQLWHSCGLMKKIAYDAADDIPKNYRGNLFGNYSLLTMSADVCVPVLSHAMRIPEKVVRATGISRTDYYFEDEWNQNCRKQFYRAHPEAEGKKIVLWAPTFRGNAAHPRMCGVEEIRKLAEQMSGEWYFIIKAHPHVDAHGQVSNCTIPTEKLFCVADVLITDYSSVLFDYLLYDRPIILFAPDLQDYLAERGFYIDYLETPYPVVKTETELKQAIQDSEVHQQEHQKEILAWKNLYVGACDGHATEKIMKLTGLMTKME